MPQQASNRRTAAGEEIPADRRLAIDRNLFAAAVGATRCRGWVHSVPAGVFVRRFPFSRPPQPRDG